MAIRDAHASTCAPSKIRLLSSFKEAVSVQAPEFRDHQQKVSHLVLFSYLHFLLMVSPLCINSSV